MILQLQRLKWSIPVLRGLVIEFFVFVGYLVKLLEDVGYWAVSVDLLLEKIHLVDMQFVFIVLQFLHGPNHQMRRPETQLLFLKNLQITCAPYLSVWIQVNILENAQGETCRCWALVLIKVEIHWFDVWPTLKLEA